MCDDERCTAAQRLKKRQITRHNHGVARRAVNRSQHSRWNWVGSLHDNMMKVMDVAEAKEGRLMELDIRNAGMTLATVDDFKKWTGDCTKCSFHAPQEKRRTTYPTLRDLGSRRGSKWSVTSIRGRVQSGLLRTPE